MKYRFPKENVRWFWAHVGMAVGIALFCFWARDFFFGDAVWIVGNVIGAIVQLRKAWRQRKKRHRYITFAEKNLGDVEDLKIWIDGNQAPFKQTARASFIIRSEEERWE